LHKKSGKRHEVPCHPTPEEYLNTCIAAAGISRDKKGRWFDTMGKAERLGDRSISQFDVLHLIKRRAEASALPYSTCCDTFRTTRITTYLQNDGTLEHTRPSLTMNHDALHNQTTARVRNSAARKLRGLRFKAVLHDIRRPVAHMRSAKIAISDPGKERR
jgi:hypothetical protein